MKIVVLADAKLKEELVSGGMVAGTEIIWINQLAGFQDHEADAYIDLLFEENDERISILKTLPPKPILINLVVNKTTNLPENFVRINAWPGFLNQTIIEASCKEEAIKKITIAAISCFNKQVEWVADIPGFITARVIAMIINEAYLTLDEKVSTKEEIDTAMKMGTNYPYGPFEWSKKIGLKNIAALLTALSNGQERYNPSSLLLKEASN